MKLSVFGTRAIQFLWRATKVAATKAESPPARTQSTVAERRLRAVVAAVSTAQRKLNSPDSAQKQQVLPAMPSKFPAGTEDS